MDALIAIRVGDPQKETTIIPRHIPVPEPIEIPERMPEPALPEPDPMPVREPQKVPA